MHLTVLHLKALASSWDRACADDCIEWGRAPQAEQIKTKEAEAKLASFTGTLQQRLLQLATEVSLALPSYARRGTCLQVHQNSDQHV